MGTVARALTRAGEAGIVCGRNLYSCWLGKMLATGWDLCGLLLRATTGKPRSFIGDCPGRQNGSTHFLFVRAGGTGVVPSSSVSSLVKSGTVVRIGSAAGLEDLSAVKPSLAR